MGTTTLEPPSTIPAETTNRQVYEPGDHEKFSHVIRKKDEMKAYVLGEPVVALCGKKWVPTRDPKKFPLCPSCKEILEQLGRDVP